MEVRCKVNKVHVKKGDTVIILSGKDKNKKGKVLEVSPTERKVIVEGCNMVTKHVKPRRMGETGGIVKAEGPAVRLQGNAGMPQVRQSRTRLAHKMDGRLQKCVCANTAAKLSK